MVEQTSASSNLESNRMKQQSYFLKILTTRFRKVIEVTRLLAVLSKLRILYFVYGIWIQKPHRRLGKARVKGSIYLGQFT